MRGYAHVHFPISTTLFSLSRFDIEMKFIDSCVLLRALQFKRSLWAWQLHLLSHGTWCIV